MTDNAIRATQTSGGVQVHLKVVAGSSRERIAGPLEGALKVAVAAPAEQGRANQAVIRLLARRLKIPARNLTLISGTTSAYKVVHIDGLTAEELGTRLGVHVEPQN